MTQLRSGVLPVLFALCAAFVSSASAAADSQAAPPQTSLYARLGGEPAVKAIANDLIDRTSSDPRLKRSFTKDVNLTKLKEHLAEQLCNLTGGGCTYTGDTMRDVHAGLKIDQAEFYGMVETLRAVLRRHNIGLAERNELLEILAPMKRDVVER